MKKFTKAILALATTAVMVTSANAAVSYGNTGSAGAYVGAKVGQMDVDKAKDATAYGVYGGYNFDQNFGLEAEFMRSEDQDYTSTTGVNRNYEAKTYGAYGTYRYTLPNTPVYFKAKAGIAKTEVDDKAVSGTSRVETDKTSLAGGVGIGFQPVENFGIEATYNRLNADAGMWGVGAHIAF